MTTKFEPGMLVALYETWPTQNIICLTLVRSVGKQQVRLDSSSQFHLDGRARTTGVYRWRAIKPVTKQVLAECKAQGVNTSLALGRVIPDDPG